MTAIVVSVVILVIIAGIEIVCLFGCSKLKVKNPSVTVALPVYSNDKKLSEKLEYMGILLDDCSIGIENLILLDCGASNEQLEACKLFCRKYPTVILTIPELIE